MGERTTWRLGGGKNHLRGLEVTVPEAHTGHETMPLSTGQNGKPHE